MKVLCHEVECQEAETMPSGPLEHGSEAGVTETQTLKKEHPYCSTGGGGIGSQCWCL